MRVLPVDDRSGVAGRRRQAPPQVLASGPRPGAIDERPQGLPAGCRRFEDVQIADGGRIDQHRSRVRDID